MRWALVWWLLRLRDCLCAGVAELHLTDFLVIVGGAATASGPGAALLEFILYATGMGLVITLLTVEISLMQVAALRSVRRVLPYVQLLSAGLLLLARAYLVYYWLTVGGILRSAIP
jgi:hypothetical protein